MKEAQGYCLEQNEVRVKIRVCKNRRKGFGVV